MVHTTTSARRSFLRLAVLATALLLSCVQILAASERLALQPENSGESTLVLYTTMATWCASCKKELPQIKKLRETFKESDLHIFGVPIDKEDSSEKLEKYVVENAPAYRLLTGLTEEQVASVQSLVEEKLRDPEALPASLVTDGAGNLLIAMWGLPTISQLRKLLYQAGR